MADTSSNVQFKVENGLLVLGTANVAGPAVFNGNVDIGGTYLSVTANLQSNLLPVNNTYSLGNSTARWTLNAMGGNFAEAVTISNTLSTGNTTVTGFANVNGTLAAGNTTITGFANVTTFVNVVGNTTVNGMLTVNNTASIGNTTITGFANIVGASATFNANTGVANTTEFITTAAAHGFTDGDLVLYTVATGNTAVSGLTNGTTYFVVSSNTTALKLSASYGGSAINLTAGVTETGHTLTPQRIRFSNSGNIDTSIGLANVGSLRVLGAAIVNGATTIGGAFTVNNTAALGNTTITGFANVTTTLQVGGVATFAANAVFDTDLVFIDGLNNRVGIKNAAPTSDLLSINGNTVITSMNAAIRFVSTNATHNSSVSLAGNTTNTRVTFITYEGNSSISDGGFIFQAANSSTTTNVLQFNQAELKYKAGNVAHAGNFGIYDVNGTRLGP